MAFEELTLNAEEKFVVGVLKGYETALNGSDTNAALALYAPDGIFMPQHSPSSIGTNEIRNAYDAVFRSITLSVNFTIAEIHQIAPEWIFARTNSAGHVKVHATGQISSEANQELFLFQKVVGVWKIARYCFATTNPPG